MSCALLPDETSGNIHAARSFRHNVALSNTGDEISQRSATSLYSQGNSISGRTNLMYSLASAPTAILAPSVVSPHITGKSDFSYDDLRTTRSLSTSAGRRQRVVGAVGANDALQAPSKVPLPQGHSSNTLSPHSQVSGVLRRRNRAASLQSPTVNVKKPTALDRLSGDRTVRESMWADKDVVDRGEIVSLSSERTAGSSPRIVQCLLRDTNPSCIAHAKSRLAGNAENPSEPTPPSGGESGGVEDVYPNVTPPSPTLKCNVDEGDQRDSTNPVVSSQVTSNDRYWEVSGAADEAPGELELVGAPQVEPIVLRSFGADASNADDCREYPEVREGPDSLRSQMDDTSFSELSHMNSAPTSGGKTRGCPLRIKVRCAIAVPYTLTLALFATLMFCITYFVLDSALQETLSDLHFATHLAVKNEVQRTIVYPELMARVVTSVYIRNRYEPQASDVNIPYESEMRRRLCATLGKADKMKLLRAMIFASITKNALAACTQYNQSTVELYGTQSVAGKLRVLENVSTTTYYPIVGYTPPPTPKFDLWGPPGAAIDSVTVHQLLTDLGVGWVLNPWIEAQLKNTVFTGSSWISAQNSKGQLLYVYPYLEHARVKEDNNWGREPFADYGSAGSSIDPLVTINGHGVGLLVLSLPLENIFNENVFIGSDDSSLHKVLVAVQVPQSSKVIVATTTWGQSHWITTANSSSTGDGGDQAELMTLDDVSDPLMLRAMEKLDAANFIRSSDDTSSTKRNVTFSYNNFFAFATIERMVTRTRLTIYIITVDNPSVVLGNLHSRRDIIIAFLVLAVVLCGVYADLITYYAMARPLASVLFNLKQARNVMNADLVATEKKPAYTPIYEVAAVQQESAFLQKRLHEIRAYLPTGLISAELDEGNLSSDAQGMVGTESCDPKKKSSNSDEQGCTAKNAKASDVLEAGQGKTNQFRRTECTILYAYFPESSSRAELTALIGTFMTVVVGAALRHGGCVESQRPECVSVSFGARQRLRAHALLAAQCAIDIAESLPQGLQQHVALVADTQTFLCGICGAHRRKALAVFGRDVSASVGSLQLRIGARVCVTEDCAQQLAGRVRALPVEVVFLEPSPFAAGGAASGTTRCVLYELSPGDVRAEQWVTYAQRYKFGFSAMERGNYKLALQAFPGLQEASVLDLEYPSLTQQLRRLLDECMVHIRSSCSSPFARYPEGLGTTPGLHLSRSTLPRCDTEKVPRRREVAALNESGVDECGAPHIYFPNESQVDDRGAFSDIQTNTCTRDERGRRRDALEGSDAAAYSPVRVVDELQLIDQSFTDCNGVVWQRARRPLGDYRIFPSFIAISATGTLAVVKVMPKNLVIGGMFASDTDWVKACEHMTSHGNDCVVHLVTHCLSERYVVPVVEYVPGGTLDDMLIRYGRQLPVPFVKKCVFSALKGLAALHARGVVHGDVRPQNLLVETSGMCRLKDGDFSANGLGREVAETDGEGRVLLPRDERGVIYSSPEVARGMPRSVASDVFAVGLVALQALTGRSPWQWSSLVRATRSKHQLQVVIGDPDLFLEALREGEIEPLDPRNMEKNVRYFLLACCAFNQLERMTAVQLLEHPLFAAM